MVFRWTIGKKLVAAFSGIALLFILFGLFTQNTISAIKIRGPLYTELIDHKDLIADILPPPAYIIESYLTAMEITAAEADPKGREQLLARLEELANGKGYYRERIAYWEQHLKDERLRLLLLKDSQVPAQRFYAVAAGDFAAAVRSDRMDKAREIFQRELKPAYLAHRQAIDKVVELAGASFVQLEEQAETTLGWRQMAMLTAFIGVVGLALAFGLLIARSISRPITAGVDILDAIARGDLVQQVPANLRRRGDEIGLMAGSLQAMVTQLGTMIREIIANVHDLTTASSGLTAIAGQLLSTAGATAGKSGTVSRSAEAVSNDIQSVAAATEQASGNVAMVASATEEMIATINEIARSAESARAISEGAVEQARRTSDKMATLGDTARSIGQVTETITEISEQTNLLALNATIEAARAGEAGKGFAVVANEIKELARQTAAATVDIRSQISGMQDTTNSTVADIGAVSQVIVEINNVISSIAAAVEQQSVASREIAGNISRVARTVGEVNSSVAHSTTAIADITREIGGISQEVIQVEGSSGRVQVSARELAELAGRLEELAQRFRV